MAAPVANYIQYPGDGNYSGPQSKVVQRLIGANITYTNVVAPISKNKIDSIYSFSLANSAITAAAQDGTSTGYFWFQNPSGSSKVASLRKLEIRFTTATAGAIDHDSAPRVVLARGTFTGTFSGATATVTKRKSTDATNSADVRAAVTGATVTLEGDLWAALCPGVEFTTADVISLSSVEVWQPRLEDDFIEVAAGECLVCYQVDTGTTSDQRLVSISGTWSERDNA